MAIRIESARGELSQEERAQLKVNVPKKLKNPEETLLEAGQITVLNIIEKTEGNHNNPFRTRVESGNKKIEAVFKPCGEGHGTNCRCSKELAVYLLDRIMGFKIVPTTVVREINDQKFNVEDVGSLQAYNYGEVADNAHLDDNENSMITLRIFDYVIWNYDRHDWNYLVTSEPKTIAIDNESSFGIKDNDSARKEIIRDIEDIADKQIPESTIKIFERYLRDPRIKVSLRKSLNDLLDNRSVNAIFTRIEKIGKFIVNDGKIPSDENSLETLTFK